MPNLNGVESGGSCIGKGMLLYIGRWVYVEGTEYANGE